MSDINNVLDYIRTLSLSDKKSLQGKTLKAAEEVGELAKVVLPYESAFATTHRFTTPVEILEECADVMLCALSIAYCTGFSTEDVIEMMKEKSDKWAQMQHASNLGEFPVPFEIHITVDMGQCTADNVELFKSTCMGLRVKPIVLDLQTGSMLKDVMTSSVIVTDNKGAYEEMKRISNGLTAAGFSVVREKIETVPWHPAAPSEETAIKAMPKDCYFECHFNIHVETDAHKEEVHRIAEMFDAHLSRNAFKITQSGYNQMMTHRVYDGTREDFAREVKMIAQEIEDSDLTLEKVIQEFSIYDTKVSHDAGWLLEKQT